MTLYEIISSKWINELKLMVKSELKKNGFPGSTKDVEPNNSKRSSAFMLIDKINSSDKNKYKDAVYNAVSAFTTKHESEIQKYFKAGQGRVSIGFNNVPGKVMIVIENDNKRALESFIDMCDELLIPAEEGFIKNIKNFIKDNDWDYAQDVDPNHKQKGKLLLSEFTKKEYIKKYRFGRIKNVSIVEWYDKNNKKIASAEIISEAHFLNDIHIINKYQGYGLSKQMLDYIISKYKITWLECFDSGKLENKIYEKFGFKEKQHPLSYKDPDNKTILMVKSGFNMRDFEIMYPSSNKNSN